MADWIRIKNINSFQIGEEDFNDLEIHSTPGDDSFYYFFNKKTRTLIGDFILDKRPRVDYLCRVTLIKKDGKFTPRLCLFTRDKHGKTTADETIKDPNDAFPSKARIDLKDCHKNFWALVSFMQSLREIEIPKESFSLVSESDTQIVTALRSRSGASVVNIIKQLSQTKGVSLSEEEINQLLNRKDKLKEFQKLLTDSPSDEGAWQDFFDNNKWIFGYGLNYQILRQQQTQPHYGGTRVDGRGAQRGDYLTSTAGEISFTVLVEIKTPNTSLLQGTQEIRNGAWSYAKELTDALSQISSNIDTWEADGSTKPENMDKLEGEGIYTVKPKGIIVIGSLIQLDTRSKRETFERFRKSLHGVEILTFDEVLKRAEFIVSEK